MKASRRWDHVCVSWSGTGSIIIRSGERIRRYAVKNPRGERATALTPAASIVGSMASTSSTVIHGNIAIKQKRNLLADQVDLVFSYHVAGYRRP